MESIREHLQTMMDRQQLNEKYRKIMDEVLKDPDVREFIQEHRDRLDKKAIERNIAKFYEFISEKNKAATNQGQLMPGYTPKLSITSRGVDVIYEPTQEFLADQQQKDIQNRIHSLYMPKEIKRASLDDFDSTPERKAALMKAYEFIETYLDAPNSFHKGLYLHGPFGVGKTYLLGAIAYELSEAGHPSTLVHFPTFAVEMKNSIQDNTVGSKLEVFKRAKILMLDDIGADSMSSWIRDDILGVILQHRMQEELPTFFSSNLDMNHLVEHLSVTQRGDEEPLKAKRMMERIKVLSEEVSMSGKNRRH